MDKQAAIRFWEKVDKSGECWIWTGAQQSGGYGRAYYGGRLVGAHRLSWELENGRIPDGMLVCHKCDVPECVRPDHLFIGTPGDNWRDAVRKGRAPQNGGEHLKSYQFTPGGSPHNATLSEGDVRDIRERIRTRGGQSLRSLADEIGVKYSLIADIRRGRSYKGVGESGSTSILGGQNESTNTLRHRR